jgi:hypothetical protein
MRRPARLATACCAGEERCGEAKRARQELWLDFYRGEKGEETTAG